MQSLMKFSFSALLRTSPKRRSPEFATCKQLPSHSKDSSFRGYTSRTGGSRVSWLANRRGGLTSLFLHPTIDSTQRVPIGGGTMKTQQGLYVPKGKDHSEEELKIWGLIP